MNVVPYFTCKFGKTSEKQRTLVQGRHGQILTVFFQPEFGLGVFLKVDIRLIIDDGRNSNEKVLFNLRDIDDDIESLYQTRAKEWFPFSLTMKVPNQDTHQTVQVGFYI